MSSLVLGLALLTPSHPPRHLPPPPPVIVEAPPPVLVPAPVALTPAEFARVFQPVAGVHKVVLVHPKTCQPVEVCFRLPHGCPKVKVSKHELQFDYGRYEVEVKFRRNGTVDVEYDR